MVVLLQEQSLCYSSKSFLFTSSAETSFFFFFFGLLGLNVNNNKAIAEILCCASFWKYYLVFRTQGMGINIITSRAGAATSPFIKVLDQLHPSTPFATVALTSFIAALCSLMLPETLNKPTKETLDDFSGMWCQKRI